MKCGTPVSHLRNCQFEFAWTAALRSEVVELRGFVYNDVHVVLYNINIDPSGIMCCNGLSHSPFSLASVSSGSAAQYVNEEIVKSINQCCEHWNAD